MRHWTYAAAMLPFLFESAPAAEVDSWRCSNVLISRDDTPDYVLDKCGQPSGRATTSEPVFARNANGSMRQIGVIESELWTYERTGRIPVRLTFQEGKLTRIEYLEP